MKRGLAVLAAVVLFALGAAPDARSAGVVARDVAGQVGLGITQQSWSVSTPDVDHDGDLDVMISAHAAAPAMLFRNDGGHFTRIDNGVFVKKDRHDCQWADVNLDGRPDAYCTIGAHNGTSVKANELWIQQPNGTFVDQAQAWNVTDPLGRGRRVTFLDVNHDHYPDLYVTNYGPRTDFLPAPNRLFINVGGTRFRSGSEYGLDQDLGNDSVRTVDYNHDGWADILLAGHNGVRIYRNDAGQSFTDVTAAVGASYPGLDALLVDVDHDGALDLVDMQLTQLIVKYGNGQNAFGPRITKLPLQFAKRLAVGDANGDGIRDLFVVQGQSFPDLLLLAPSLTVMPTPQATSGAGDVATSFDFDHNGLADFLVLNGGGEPGPVQLIAMFPS